MTTLKLLKRRVQSSVARLFGVEFIKGKATYNNDGLLTLHNSDFQSESRFANAYRHGADTGSWGGMQIQWRAHVVAWAARQGLQLEGDFVECGVNKGGMASVVYHYTQLWQTSKRFWLLDTFNGLADEGLTTTESERAQSHWSYSECFEEVRSRFSDAPNVVLVRGAVPGTLPQVTAEKIAYLGIDMNCTEPEIAAATHFWPRLSPGALIVLDDYGWSGHDDQRHAFDQFANERGISILSLPTGQGLMIKP